MGGKGRFEDKSRIVLDEICQMFQKISSQEIEKLTCDITDAKKVFLVGVGRVLLSCQAWAKRLNHIGINACCVGDITEPALTKEDILIVVSGSGESVIPVVIAKKAGELGAKRIIHIGSNVNGSVKQYIDYMVRIPTRTRLYLPDEIQSEQIMTSLFEQVVLILGDVISQMIVERENINIEELWKMHANLE